MKKKYNTPTVEVVSVAVPAIMTKASNEVSGTDPYNEDERGHFEYHGTGESRNDWDNIWSGM